MVPDKIFGRMMQNDDEFMDYWIIAGFKQMGFYIICKKKCKIIIEVVWINLLWKALNCVFQ